MSPSDVGVVCGLSLVGTGAIPLCLGHSCEPPLSWEERESVERKERHWPVVSISSQHHLELLPVTVMAIFLLGAGEGISGHLTLQFPNGSWISAVCGTWKASLSNLYVPELVSLLVILSIEENSQWSESGHWHGSP